MHQRFARGEGPINPRNQSPLCQVRGDEFLSLRSQAAIILEFIYGVASDRESFLKGREKRERCRFGAEPTVLDNLRTGGGTLD